MKSTADLALLDRHLSYLCLSFLRQHCQSLATEAARKELSHLDYLAAGTADSLFGSAIQANLPSTS
jgi:hypothetical protein